MANINYFIKKQILLLSKISIDYIRTDYFNHLAEDEKLVGLLVLTWFLLMKT